ncbi:MAG: folate-binding protein YgfZ [Burkholderiales bacterium]|nr:folate-binding protein YgfZ [Burkholderiales bacterium]
MMWQEFLEQQGAKLNAFDVTGFSHAWESDAIHTGFFTSLNHLGLIQVSGADAASFLHGQLSNDVEHLTPTEVRRAAYCTPKGRMLASFMLWKTGEDIQVQLSRAIQPAIQKRLQMYVLRAKAKLADVSDNTVQLGLGGAHAGAALQNWFPALPTQIDSQVSNEFGILQKVADANQSARYQWITSNETAQLAWPVLSQQLQAVNASAWRLTEIQAGIAQIVALTQEQFVPQMLNFEMIGGVNFKKGCYPGQEIVARSQYLGKLKRRMAIASIAQADVTPAMEVFSESDPAQPCGMVVNAEQDSANSSLALIEMKLADQEAGHIHLSSADGAEIRFLPLPYVINDITQ